MGQYGWNEGPRIYNLFPLLAGPMPQWSAHIERARAMGFNWLFINPIQQSGFSGSLYSIKDYYAIDARMVDPSGEAPQDQLRAMVGTVHSAGMRLMLDLVINHTAIDSPLVREHPQWYRRGPDAKPLHPGTQDGERLVTWGDLYQIDNEASPDRERLWRYWIDLAKLCAASGFNGFRCDAAYKVPGELWRRLIGEVKHSAPGAMFFAESLGCPFEDTLELGRAGFDFLFNSSKWWDFTAPWCLKQYRESGAVVPSISFAESHDTERLAAELGGDREAVKMRYAFSALFSTGVMMPMGFEYGFRRAPQRRQDTAAGLGAAGVGPQRVYRRGQPAQGVASRIQRGRADRRGGLRQSGAVRVSQIVARPLGAGARHPQQGSQKCTALRPRTARISVRGAGAVEDVSPEMRLAPAPGTQICRLEPSGVGVLVARFG